MKISATFDKFCHFLWYQMPPVIVAVTIFVLSSLHKLPQLYIEFDLQDKAAHAITFGTLAYLVARALYHQSRFPWLQRNLVWIAIIFTIFYGITDEFHQAFVPGRFSDVWDVVADGVGAVLGVLIFRWRHSRDWQPVYEPDNAD